jgi:glycerol-3-phosphate acyltransferase PlsY
MAILIALWAFAYVLGALPTTHLVAKVVGGVDLRTQGSGNVGASNLSRQLGKRWFPVVTVIELTRGAGPILCGHYVLGLEAGSWGLICTPLFTVVGNNWSPALRFTGGRGVGVWAAGLLALAPIVFAIALMVYVAAWAATRRSAESLLAVMAALPVLSLFAPHQLLLLGSPVQIAVYAAAGVALIVVKRLLANGEPLPPERPAAAALLNRLIRDRDVLDRREWLARTPEEPGIPDR